MLKIRLRRMGSRHRPFYRVVVSDSRQVPTASAVEELGYYDPRKTPAIIQIDTERVDFWAARGAQLSESVAKLVRRVRSGLTEAPAPEAAEEESKAEPKADKKAEPKADEKAEPKADEKQDEPKADDAAEATEAAEDSADSADSDEAPTAEAKQA